MRQIKFRGKRIDNGEQLDGTELTLITMITNSKGVFLCSCWITKSEQSLNRRKRTIFPERDSEGRFVKRA